MYEYSVINRETEEQHTFYGYSFNDACRRLNENPENWQILRVDYCD